MAFGPDTVFKDVNSIALGDDFRNAIAAAVGESRVLLVIIGDQWLDFVGESGTRRLDEADDSVRIEVESALTRKIPVIPVLVGQRAMPSAKALPESLSELSFRNAIRIRADPDFKGDMERLCSRIRSSLTTVDVASRLFRSWMTRRTLLGVAFAGIVSVAALRLMRPRANFEIVEKETGQLVLRDFKVLYKLNDATQALAVANGFGGKCTIPENFTEPDSVECYGYVFTREIVGNRLILDRNMNDDEFEKAIRPARDTYDLPTPTDFELAKSSVIDPDNFALVVENESSDVIDLIFLYHDPRDGALQADSWELIPPPIQPHSERSISGFFHRQPGYFVIFASTHGRTARHLLSANLYSGNSPKLKVVATANGLSGRLAW